MTTSTLILKIICYGPLLSIVSVEMFVIKGYSICCLENMRNHHRTTTKNSSYMIFFSHNAKNSLTSFSEPKLKSLDGSYHSDHGDRDYKTADYLIEKRDVDREKEREKHTYSYTSPSYESKHKYELKHERVRGEKSYEDEKYTSLETSSR